MLVRRWQAQGGEDKPGPCTYRDLHRAPCSWAETLTWIFPAAPLCVAPSRATQANTVRFRAFYMTNQRSCYQFVRMVQCPAAPSKPLSTAAPEMLKLAGYSSSLTNQVSFQLPLWLAKVWEAFSVPTGRYSAPWQLCGQEGPDHV